MQSQQIEKAPSDQNEALNQIVKQENELVNDYDIDGFLQKRKEFITKVNKIMVKDKDYHVIQTKKSLAKGGAEKIASIFGWTASFSKDAETMEAFSELKGTICYICNLEKSGSQIGQGRGAATLSKNNNDPNKTIKMAQKSAFIDAVLRSSGLSDFFTQDLEDMPVSEEAPLKSQNIASGSPEPKGTLATKKQIGFIHGLLKKKGKEDLVSDEQINNLTMIEAKNWIDKLLTYPDVQVQKEEEIPTIQVEEI